MMSRWPDNFGTSSELQKVLNLFRPQDSEETDYHGYLMKKAMKTGNIKKIFQGSIHYSRDILLLDDGNANGRAIDDLSKEDFQRAAIMNLCLAKSTDLQIYNILLNQVEKRMEGIPVRDLVQRELKDATDLHFNQLSQA